MLPPGEGARGGLGLFLCPGVPEAGEVGKGCLSSLECLYYTHSAERNMHHRHTEHTGPHGKSCQGSGEYMGSDKHQSVQC